MTERSAPPGPTLIVDVVPPPKITGVFQTDKVTHGYLPTYLRIAAEIGVRGRVCEVGVHAGASLRMWQALFPYGLIVGVDNQSAPIPDSATLESGAEMARYMDIVRSDQSGSFWPDGTESVVAEQDDPALAEKIAAFSPAYDLIVDDASHVGCLTRATFGLLWPLVAPGRFYVIEDWSISVWHNPMFTRDNGEMLEAVQSLLLMLDSQDSEVESVEYRYGLAIVRKRG